MGDGLQEYPCPADLLTDTIPYGIYGLIYYSANETADFQTAAVTVALELPHQARHVTCAGFLSPFAQAKGVAATYMESPAIVCCNNLGL